MTLELQLHHDYLDMYEKEPMRKPSTVPFMGHKIDLTKVTNDVFFLAGVTDHITPWKAVYRSMKLLGSPDKTFVLSSSGHIQSLINPPGKEPHEPAPASPRRVFLCLDACHPPSRCSGNG